MKSPILNLSPKKIALVLGVIALLLAIIYGVLFYINSAFDISRVSRSFIELFNLDAEVSISTWFSQTLLLIIALLLGWIAVWRHREKAKKLEIVEWSALSAIALFMSIDDGAAVHEKFSMFIEQYIGDMTGTFFYFSWVILGMAIIALMVLVFFRLWWSLPAKTKWLLALGGAMFVSGSIGMEMLAGHQMSIEGMDDTYRLIVLGEESLEMFGSVVAIYALMDFMTSQKMSLEMRVR